MGTPGRRKSAWSLVGFVGSAALTFVAVVATTRALGRDEYGVYVGIAAYVGLVAPFTTLGTGQVLVSRVSTDRTAFARSWGAVLASFLLVGGPLFAASILLGAVVLPDQDLRTIALLAGVEFIGLGLMASTGDACMALERYGALAAHFIAVAAVRAGAGLVLLGTGGDDVAALALYQLVGMLAVGLASALWLTTHGRPRLAPGSLPNTWRLGSQFAFGRVADTVMTNVDRTMLLRSGFEGDAGLYGAGVRLISYGILPARSVLVASYTGFFKLGQQSVGAAAAHGRRVARPAVALTIGGTIAAIVGTPIAIRFFGEGFDDTLLVVVAMAGFPVLRTLQALVGNTLTGSGFQSYRASAQFVAAVGNVAMNIVLIPRYQWQGAVVATYLTEIGFLLMLAVGVRSRIRAEQAASAPA